MTIFPTSEMTCIVSGGALNSTHSLTPPVNIIIKVYRQQNVKMPKLYGANFHECCSRFPQKPATKCKSNYQRTVGRSVVFVAWYNRWMYTCASVDLSMSPTASWLRCRRSALSSVQAPCNTPHAAAATALSMVNNENR